jgi:hypothetical protein
MNTVTVVGNLTRDPELRYTPTGQAVVKFGIAVKPFLHQPQRREGRADRLLHRQRLEEPRRQHRSKSPEFRPLRNSTFGPCPIRCRHLECRGRISVLLTERGQPTRCARAFPTNCPVSHPVPTLFVCFTAHYAVKQPQNSHSIGRPVPGRTIHHSEC